MQLVAYGAQDIYLTGNPQITFFKVVYRRHTNFATESIEQTFTGSVDFGRKISSTIDRNGDLLYKMYLEVDLDLGEPNTIMAPGGVNGCDIVDSLATNGDSTCNSLQVYATRLGHALIREMSIEIGGQCIDTHYGEWMELWSQLTLTNEQLKKERRLIDGHIRDTSACAKNGKTSKRKLYIPLQFWFNRNPGLALPLIALQYHEVKLNVFLESALQCGFNTKNCTDKSKAEPKITQICLFCDYVFLDTDERRRFAQVSHEYLIEQLQFNNITSVAGAEACANVELRFNHPCKEIVWTVQPQIEGCTSGGDKPRCHPFDWSRESAPCGGRGTTQQEGTGALDNCLKAKLQLNGHDRFRERQGTYFRCVQPFQHYTGAALQGWIGNVGAGGTTSKSAYESVDNGFFYAYSFALKPEEHQPSGTCNFSRIDNANLQLTLSVTARPDGTTISDPATRFIKVYATNYNVLRIMSGMGGLAYSN